ncbi:MAG: hypothetical protein Q9159_002672 [Coniocarpon cinnabarinum]
MAKDRTVNPATAALKATKNAAIKKSKAATLASRTEKLARRNPDRLQKQLDELQRQKDAQGGQLRPKDQQTLENLERDVKAVRKARESSGAQSFPPRRDDDTVKREDRREKREGRGERSHLGKRRYGQRDSMGAESESTDTEEDVKAIPMPEDTAPPFPPRAYQRKVRKGLMTIDEAFAERNRQEQERREAEREREKRAAVPARRTYESAPQMRDLTAEASKKFVPAAVAARQRQGRMDKEAREGRGRLLEPEELEAMERKDRGENGEDRGGGGVMEGKDRREFGEDRGGGGAMEEEERNLLEELEGERKHVDKDVEAVAEEMEKVAEHEMMANNARGDAEVESALRHVEMEEVEDEEAGGQPSAAPEIQPMPAAAMAAAAASKDDEDDFW